MRRVWISLVLIIALAITAWPQQVHKDKRTSYAIGALPDSWKPIKIKDADFAYFRPDGGVSISVNSTCGINGSVPLQALTAHLMVDMTDRKIEPSKEILMDGRAALETVMAAKLDGAEVKMDLRVVKIESCVYDFTYVAPPDSYGKGFDDFEAMVAGFHADRK